MSADRVGAPAIWGRRGAAAAIPPRALRSTPGGGGRGVPRAAPPQVLRSEIVATGEHAPETESQPTLTDPAASGQRLRSVTAAEDAPTLVRDDAAPTVTPQLAMPKE